ncbi:MAG: hypothetical protein AAGF47_11745 [Planctomycetota bacterium]
MDAPPPMFLPPPVSPEHDPASLVLVVVGAHLRAELGDRAAGMWLTGRLDAAVRPLRLRACTVTDLWQINDTRLAGCPAVSVGGPTVNALTARLADRLPSVLSVEGRLIVQMDLEGIELSAACWGDTHAATRRACELFDEKYLGAFVESIAAATA